LSENKSEKLRYTVLLVPNNAGRVKQFRISFDLIIFISLLAAVVVLGAALFVVNTAQTLNQKDEEISKLHDVLLFREQEEIVREARIEELENTLREAKNTIETARKKSDNAEKKSVQAAIPSVMPVKKATSVPEYQDEEGKQYIQFLVEEGTRIYATADGTVKSLTKDEKYGYFLRIDHGNGYESEYILKAKPRFSVDDKVSRGNTLFVVGLDVTTLSYRIYYDDKIINPMDVIKIDG